VRELVWGHVGGYYAVWPDAYLRPFITAVEIVDGAGAWDRIRFTWELVRAEDQQGNIFWASYAVAAYRLAAQLAIGIIDFEASTCTRNWGRSWPHNG